jgi:hypothetical protein
VGYLAGFIIVIATIVLTVTDPHKGTILTLLSVTLGATGLVCAYWLKKAPVVEIVPIHNNINNGGST